MPDRSAASNVGGSPPRDNETGESLAAHTASREERALDLLVQASRVDPKLREAVAEVEKWVRRLQEDRASAWQSYEEADREAALQMGSKLEAQMALRCIVEALDLRFDQIGCGWKESTEFILARIEEIVDEADRLARQRDLFAERIKAEIAWSYEHGYEGRARDLERALDGLWYGEKR